MNRLLLLALLVGCAGPASDDVPVEQIQLRSTDSGVGRGVDGTPAWTDQGAVASSGFGWSLDGVGDVNGDGYEDVLVGAPFANSNGTIYLYLGGEDGLAASPVWSQTGQCLFGATVTGLGDVNGDGLGDFAAGDACASASGTNTGGVYIWYGSTDPAALPSTAPTILSSGQPGSSSGEGVTGVGDVNGDGYGDVAFSATLWSNVGGVDVGTVRLHLGAPPVSRGRRRPGWSGNRTSSSSVRSSHPPETSTVTGTPTSSWPRRASTVRSRTQAARSSSWDRRRAPT